METTPLRCSKHTKLRHDFFISYRVSSDSINAEKLAAHLDGKARPDGNPFSTYLDKNCLTQGRDWEAGFTFGIRHSNAIILLISQGLINTMAGKAKRNEVDNVNKEHLIALELMDQGRLIIPVYVASLSTTKAKRDCYIKLDTEAALRLFDGDDEADDVRDRLLERRAVLEKIFQLPTSVDIEPDSISEKVPKILQLWYSEFGKEIGINLPIKKTKAASVHINPCVRVFKYPTQSFRLILVGACIGLFGLVLSLSLLLMRSKSKRHTDLKSGVAIGNILGFVILILIMSILSSQYFFFSNNLYCTKCEAIFATRMDSYATNQYYNQIPYINTIANETCASVQSSTTAWQSCICFEVYEDCGRDYAKSIFLNIMIGLFAFMIIGTVWFSHRFTRNEAFSASLQ